MGGYSQKERITLTTDDIKSIQAIEIGAITIHKALRLMLSRIENRYIENMTVITRKITDKNTTNSFIIRSIISTSYRVIVTGKLFYLKWLRICLRLWAC
jgi:hypothetical protein